MLNLVDSRQQEFKESDNVYTSIQNQLKYSQYYWKESNCFFKTELNLNIVNIWNIKSNIQKNFTLIESSKLKVFLMIIDKENNTVQILYITKHKIKNSFILNENQAIIFFKTFYIILNLDKFSFKEFELDIEIYKVCKYKDIFLIKSKKTLLLYRIDSSDYSKRLLKIRNLENKILITEANNFNLIKDFLIFTNFGKPFIYFYEINNSILKKETVENVKFIINFKILIEKDNFYYYIMQTDLQTVKIGKINKTKNDKFILEIIKTIETKNCYIEISLFTIENNNQLLFLNLRGLMKGKQLVIWNNKNISNFQDWKYFEYDCLRKNINSEFTIHEKNGLFILMTKKFTELSLQYFDITLNQNNIKSNLDNIKYNERKILNIFTIDNIVEDEKVIIVLELKNYLVLVGGSGLYFQILEIIEKAKEISYSIINNEIWIFQPDNNFMIYNINIDIKKVNYALEFSNNVPENILIQIKKCLKKSFIIEFIPNKKLFILCTGNFILILSKINIESKFSLRLINYKYLQNKITGVQYSQNLLMVTEKFFSIIAFEIIK